MFFLKKIFKLRDSSGGQHAEKPFLEHLEDLRDLIFRVVVTLVVATIACYIFRDTLLDVLRRPIEQVWQQSEEAKLPTTITPATWEKAKQAADRTSSFSPEQRQHFYSQFEDEKFKFYVDCARYYRAAIVIEDKEKQKQFVASISDLPDDKRTLINELLEKGPSANLNTKRSAVFMQSLKPTETFMLALKLSVFAGVIVSFPLLLFFILQFVVPGLKPKERKALYPALLIGFGLFLSGVFFCYFSVLPKALDFFFEYGKDMGVENEWRIGEYISFTTQFTLIFGLAFELPVVVMTLVKIGLLSYETMRNTRSYAIIAIVVVGAVITPTGDALTLSMLSAPMIVLYEICIWLAYFSRKKELAAEEEEREAIRQFHLEQADKGEQAESSEDRKVHDYEDDYDPAYFDEDEDESHDHVDEYGMPRVRSASGKIPVDADYDSDEIADYDHEFNHDGDEGEEIDDGEVPEHDTSDDGFVAEDDEDDQLTEDALRVKHDDYEQFDFELDSDDEEADPDEEKPGETSEEDDQNEDQTPKKD